MLIIGELLKQADLYISEGLHPRIVSEGFDKAKEKALQVRFGLPIGMFTFMMRNDVLG